MLRENNCKTIPSASTPKYLIMKEIKKNSKYLNPQGFRLKTVVKYTWN